MASPTEKSRQRTWVKPELIVLVRGRPEEAVLAACKGDDFTHQANQGNVGGCGISFFECIDGCQVTAPS